MELTLKIWRQKNQEDKGQFKIYVIKDISPDISFLELLDTLNEDLTKKGEDPVAFAHDCREGICGTCGIVVNGRPHGPEKRTATCQLHMRSFRDGDEIVMEPFRAKAFPVLKDLIVDRSALDRIQQSGGYVSVNTGNAIDGNIIPIPPYISEEAFDAAACIGCGACVATCTNASAMLFVGAKVSHLSLLPQGHPERNQRVLNMIGKMDEEMFGSCTNTGACEVECPKEISISHIARLHREYLKASLCSEEM